MKTYKELREASGYMMTQDKANKKAAGAASEELLRKNRTKINNALIKAGLDGNGRFRTISAMQIAADQVMTPLGFAVDWDEMSTAGNTGRKAITILAFLDGPGNGKPIEIKQRKFSIQWELRNPNDSAPKQWAAVAYVS